MLRIVLQFLDVHGMEEIVKEQCKFHNHQIAVKISRLKHAITGQVVLFILLLQAVLIRIVLIYKIMELVLVKEQVALGHLECVLQQVDQKF